MMEKYQWWRNARHGREGAIHVDDPQPGFYRTTKVKGGPKLPLAIYPNEHGIIVGHFDGHDIGHDRVCQLWPFAARNHVDEEVWRAVAELGHPWPDVDAAVEAQRNKRGIGDNKGPTDEADVIKEQIESASAGLSEYTEITSDEHRDRAQTLRSRLLELSGQADKLRDNEKRPHLKAGKDIDARWRPLVTAAKTAADSIRAALSKWETRKFQEQQEAQRKAEQAVAAEGSFTRVPVPVAPPPPPAKFKGGAGRAASTHVVKTIKSVADWPALMAHFAETQEVRALVLDLAQKAVRAGYTVPGVEVQDEVKVR